MPSSLWRLAWRAPLVCLCHPAKYWRAISPWPYRCFKRSIPTQSSGSRRFLEPFGFCPRATWSSPPAATAWPSLGGEAAPSLCVERAVRHLSIEEVRAALLAALDIAGVRLEILEFSNQPLPPGELAFQRTSLNKPPGNDPQTPVIWRGKLIYDDQHSLPVWAKVKISVDREIFLAADTIPKGAVIRADQVTSTRVRQFPSLERWPGLPFVIVGKVARRTLPAGQPIVAEGLDDFKDVLRGETVHVLAMDGGASVLFDAIAQSSGQKGDVIMLHNPSSGRNFRALIEGREQVVVRGTL